VRSFLRCFVSPTTHAEQVELAYAPNVTLTEKFQLHSCSSGGSAKLLIVAALLHPIKFDIEAAVNAGKFGTQTAHGVMRLGPIANRVPPVFTSPFPRSWETLESTPESPQPEEQTHGRDAGENKILVEERVNQAPCHTDRTRIFVGCPKNADVTLDLTGESAQSLCQATPPTSCLQHESRRWSNKSKSTGGWLLLSR
jgi:hypothetical protein